MTRASSEPLLQPGSTLAGKYRVERVLGEGGMGVVLQAHHLQLDERVAIKVPRLEALTNPEAVGRFLREARAAVKIKSEHVARVNDVGTLETGQPYIVMELLEGVDLAAWLQSNGPLPVEQAVEFVLQASEALAEAHALGMVHRDLKPANLFCTQRRDGSRSIKVLDFGISKLSRGGPLDASITSASSVMGSPLYMSPEQLQSTRDVDARSDIWSMGVVLYELLTGLLPFEADTLMGLGIAIAHAVPASLREVREDVPAALEHVVFHCLEKDRAQRYNDIAQFAQALHEFAPERARASVQRIALVLQGGAALAGTLSQPDAAVSASPDSISPDQLPHAQTRQSAPRIEAARSPLAPGSTQANTPADGTPVIYGARTTAANAPVSSDKERGESVRVQPEPKPATTSHSGVRASGLVAVAALGLGVWFWLKQPAPTSPRDEVTNVVLAPASVQALPSTAANASPASANAAPSASADPAMQPAPPVARSAPLASSQAPEPPQPGNAAEKQLRVPPNPKKPALKPPRTGTARNPRADCDPPYTVNEKGDKQFKAECF